MLDGERIGRVVEVALGEDALVGDGLDPMGIRPAVAPEGDDIAGVVAASWLRDDERANWCGSGHARRCDEKDTHAKCHHHGNEASKTEAQDGDDNHSLPRHAHRPTPEELRAKCPRQWLRDLQALVGWASTGVE